MDKSFFHLNEKWLANSQPLGCPMNGFPNSFLSIFYCAS